MLKDSAKIYYLEKDMNCAESVFLACRDEWNLDIPVETAKAMGGFGGGVGVGHLCGAISGGVAALGFLVIDERSHESPRMGNITAEFMERCENELGSVMCTEIKKTHRNDNTRCLQAVEDVCDILDKMVPNI